jgi:hypothetical protein
VAWLLPDKQLVVLPGHPREGLSSLECQLESDGRLITEMTQVTS